MNASSTTCGCKRVPIAWRQGDRQVVPVKLKSGLTRRWPRDFGDGLIEAVGGAGGFSLPGGFLGTGGSGRSLSEGASVPVLWEWALANKIF